jgi:hypothetical protein
LQTCSAFSTIYAWLAAILIESSPNLVKFLAFSRAAHAKSNMYSKQILRENL